MKEKWPGIRMGLALGLLVGVLLGMLITKIRQDTILLAVGLLMLVGINVALGTWNSKINGTFDEVKFWNGIKKGCVVAVCFAAFYLVGQIEPGYTVIEINERTFTVGTAADILMTSAYVLYAKDVFDKLYKMIIGETPGAEQKPSNPGDET